MALLRMAKRSRMACNKDSTRMNFLNLINKSISPTCWEPIGACCQISKPKRHQIHPLDARPNRSHGCWLPYHAPIRRNPLKRLQGAPLLKRFFGIFVNAVTTQSEIAVSVYGFFATSKKRLNLGVSLHTPLLILFVNVFEKMQ